MSRKPKVRRSVGDLLAVPIGDGDCFAFGLVLDDPLVAFFDFCAESATAQSAADIAQKPVAFKIWVMNQPIHDGSWPVIGHAPVPEELLAKPWFFKQDPITGEVSIGRTGAEEVRVDPAEVASLERAAVWSAVHVVDRLQDHFAGRPNKWVESMKVKSKVGGR